MLQLALMTFVVVIFGIGDVQSEKRLEPYLEVLTKQGSEPVRFIAEKLRSYFKT